ncbi:periplasmic binding protein-like I [Paraphysoderma sedebokerense]|nr:periplasmic binding protein-like I [Paraphysoderma sedebokerense]
MSLRWGWSFILLFLACISIAYAQQQYAIGLVLPLTEPGNEDLPIVFDMALEEINNNTRYNTSFTLSRVSRDEGTWGNATLALQGVTELHGNVSSLVGYIGPMYSSSVTSSGVLASMLQKPMIAPYAASALLADKTFMPFVFRLSGSFISEAEYLAKFVISSGFKNVALFVDEDEKGYYSLRKFRSITDPEGIVIRSILTVGPRMDLNQTFVKLRESKVSMIIYIAGSDVADVVLMEAVKQNMVGSNYMWILNTFGYYPYNDLWPGAFYLDPYMHVDSTLQEIMIYKFMALRNKSFQQLDLGISEMYDSVYLFAETALSLVQAGRNPLNGWELRESFRNISVNLTRGLTSFDSVSQDFISLYELMNVKNATARELYMVQWSAVNKNMDKNLIYGDLSRTMPTDGSEPTPDYSHVTNRTSAIVNEESFVILNVRNRFQEPVQANISDIRVSATQLKTQRTLNNFYELEAQNETVKIKYRFSEPGLYAIKVYMSNKEVSSGEFNIQVSRRLGAPAYIKEADPTAKVIQALASLIYIAVVATTVMLFIHRNKKPIKALSIPFCMLMLAGVLFAATSMFFFYGQPTQNSCTVIIWLLPVGFGMCWGSLVGKTVRVYSIFNNVHQMEAQKFNRTTVILTTAITAFEVLIAFLWTVIDPPRPTEFQPSEDGDRYMICDSTNSRAFSIVFYLYNGLLVMYSIYLSILIRRVVVKLYNESLTIGSTVYIITISCCAVLPIVYLVNLTLEVKAILVSVLIFIGAMAIVIILFWSRLWFVVNDSKKTGEKPGSQPSHSFLMPNLGLAKFDVLDTASFNSTAQKTTRSISDTKVSTFHALVQESKLIGLSRWEEVEVMHLHHFNSCFVTSKESKTIFSFDIRKVTFTKLPPAPLENGQKLSMVSVTLPDGKKLQFQSLSPEIDIEAIMKGQL